MIQLLPAALALALQVTPSDTFLLSPVLPAAAAHPDDLDPARLPADAHWVFHLDFERALESQLVRAAREALPDLEREFAEHLTEIHSELGIDPLHDIFSLTACGLSGESAERAVVYVRASAAADKALEMLKAQPSYRAEEIGGYRVHGIAEAGAPVVHLRRDAEGERRTVVLAHSREDLLLGLRTLDGSAPSLATKPGRLWVKPAPGSFFFASVGEDLIRGATGFAPASEVARLARSVVIDVGEHEGWFFGQLSIETAGPREARQIENVLRGATSLLSLFASQADPEDQDAVDLVMDLMDSLKFDTEGSVVAISFMYESSELVEQLKRLGNDD